MTLNELLEQSKNTYINYNLKINRNKNRFKETNKSITKNLSNEEVKRIKKNKLKPFSDKSFNLNIEPNETEILSNKNINLYDRYSMYSVFGIGESKYKDLLINEKMDDNMIDNLLNEMGNKNISKKGLRKKNSSKDLYDFNFNNSSLNEKLFLTETNMIIYGYNKSEDNKYQYPVSYSKNNINFIRNFTHLTYNGNINLRKSTQFELADELDNCIFDNNTKQKYFDFLTNLGFCSDNYAIELLNNNDKETIKKILKTKKIRFNTGYSKVITLDCDFENNLEGSIKKDYIFYILRNFKYVIVENKDKFKHNHFTICLFLSTFREIDFVSRIRDMFKIAGICDNGHQTIFGKNMFNTELYNVYYNENGKYLDENFKEFENSIIGECCNVNEKWLQHLGVELNNNINIKLHEMSLLNDKNKNNIKLNLIDFTKSNEFIDYANNHGLTFKIKKLNNITIDNETKIKKPESIGYDELCKELREQKIKSINELYNKNIIFQEDHRIKNCRNFGFMLGSYFKLNLDLKQILDIFDKIVKVFYDEEEKHKEMTDYVIEGFIARNKKKHKNDDGIEFNNWQIYSGNITTNSRSTMKTMKIIIEEIIKFKNKNKSIITIKDKLNKKHKRYESFINDVCNMIYYSKIEDINEWLYNYMLNWLYSHTLEKAFENFKLHNDGKSCYYILRYEDEFNKFYNEYIIKELKELKPEKEKISFIEKIFKPIKKLFTFNNFILCST